MRDAASLSRSPLFVVALALAVGAIVSACQQDRRQRPGVSAGSSTSAAVTGSSGVGSSPRSGFVRTWPPVSVEGGLGIAWHPSLGAGADSALRRARDLDAIAAAGFRIVRIDFTWSRIEPNRGGFDFSAYDRVVDEVAARGIEVLAVLCYGNPWASRSGDRLAPPDDPADFANFARATAGHFRGRVRLYEVWNEQNVGFRFWRPLLGGDPRAYADLLAHTHAAIKAADSAAVVSFGGTFYPELPVLVGGTLAFTEEAYRHRADLARFSDAFAYHPYRYPFSAPESHGLLGGLGGQVPLVETVDRVRGLLSRHGDAGKPVWITESGWHTARRSLPFAGVSESDQARYLVRSSVSALSAGVELNVWYTLRDGPRHAEWQEDAFGLLAYDPDLLDAALPRRKPAYEAHRTLVGALVGTRFQRDVRSDLGLPAHARAFRFVGAGSREVTVLWTTSSSLRVRLPLAAGAVVARQVAMDGTTTMVPPAAAGQPVVELTVSQDPIFVEAVR